MIGNDTTITKYKQNSNPLGGHSFIFEFSRPFSTVSNVSNAPECYFYIK